MIDLNNQILLATVDKTKLGESLIVSGYLVYNAKNLIFFIA